LETEDFEKAKDKVLMGVERRSMVISDEEKKNTAYHEAGHTIIGQLLPKTDPVHKVSIIPRGGALGVTLTLPDEDKLSITRERANNEICMLLGGRLAEELIFGDFTSGASNDIERATGIARRMVCNWGMSDTLGTINFTQNESTPFGHGPGENNSGYSEETSRKIDEGVSKIIQKNYKLAKELLTEKKHILENMSKALILWETLDSTQIKALMEGKDIGSPLMTSTDDDSGDNDDVESEEKVSPSSDAGEDEGPVNPKLSPA
ncbi:MAG: cell division protein FtsH, partial [Bacteriovoracaceae bacterium]